MENNELSPLVRIKQKELAIADRLAEAKQSAEAKILAARQSATATRDQAEKQAQEEATAFYRAELAAVEQEAETIGAEGERVAAKIGAHGTLVLEQAVTQIIEIVLPHRPAPSS